MTMSNFVTQDCILSNAITPAKKFTIEETCNLILQNVVDAKNHVYSSTEDGPVGGYSSMYEHIEEALHKLIGAQYFTELLRKKLREVNDD